MNISANTLNSHSILDRLLAWLTQPISFKAKTSKAQYLSCKVSKNSKGKLYVISRSHSTHLITYKLTYEDGQGSILVVFNHLGKLRQKLDKSILKCVASGNLTKADTLCKQRKNMHIDTYTHRLQIFRVKKSKHLSWLIDLDFHKTDSYGSGTGIKVITSCLESLLNEPLSHLKYGDYLDNMLDQDLIELIQHKAGEFYPYFSQKRCKCMVSSDPTLSHSHQAKPSANHQS